MERSRRQIAFFLSCYQDALIKQANSKKSTNEAASISTSDVYKLLSDYATLGQKSHAARLWFYLHHRAWKCGAVRKIMQILWG